MKSFILLLEENVVEKSNLENTLQKFSYLFPDNKKDILNKVESFVRNFIIKNDYKIKFLNACTPFAGVRTKDTIIICSPGQMSSLGDFLYTIFHEIRHEQQISNIKMQNPLIDMDLEDFEKLYKQYWEMELDADQYAKNMLVKLVSSLRLEKENIKKIFGLSAFIEKYPQQSDMIRQQIKSIINYIKEIRASGQEYNDIQDHPLVKSHLDKLERFI